MCKHVAAVLYGIGARIDQEPEILFRLHNVDEKELIAGAAKGVPLSRKTPAGAKVIAAGEDLSELFGLDMAEATEAAPAADAAPRRPAATRKSSTAKKK
jgi:uncharacterized Zn finger protein